MSLLDEALQIHAEALQEASGECVQYVRGDLEIDDVAAVMGDNRFDEFPSEGDARIASKAVDWLIEPCQLLDDDGNEFEPSRGDRIVNEKGHTFEVYPGPDEVHWRWSARRTRYRIHTVQR